MAIVSKTNRDGVDVVIENLQQAFYPSLIGYWDSDAVYTSYPRSNKNYREDNIIPEISLNQKEYQEVLNTDKFSCTSFWLDNDTAIYDEDLRQYKQSISIIFQADLVKLYGSTERLDERFDMDVYRVIKSESKFVVGDIERVKGIDNVYNGLSISGDLKNMIKTSDMSKFHVVKFTFEVIYKDICNRPIVKSCPGVSISLDGVFSEVVPSGGSFNCVQQGDDVTTEFNDTPTSADTPPGSNLQIIVVDDDDNPKGTLETDQALIKEIRIASSNVSNSDDSYSVDVLSEEDLELPNITVTDSDGSTSSYPSVKNVVCTPAATVLNTANLYKTGQETPYYDEDDGDNQFGNGVDFVTLSHNNYWSNTDRFTDSLGGQTYANNEVWDWSTWNQISGEVNVWYRVVDDTNYTFENASDVAKALTHNSHTNWTLPNRLEILSIFWNEFDTTQLIGFEYPPFNIDLYSYSNVSEIWSNTRAESINRCYTMGRNGNQIGRAWASPFGLMVNRKGNTSEL